MMFHRRHRISTRALLGECLWTWAILARNILVTILSFLTRRYRLLTTIPHCCWRLLSSTSNICTVRLYSSWIMALLEVPNDPIFTKKDDAWGGRMVRIAIYEPLPYVVWLETFASAPCLQPALKAGYMWLLHVAANQYAMMIREDAAAHAARVMNLTLTSLDDSRFCWTGFVHIKVCWRCN